MAEREYLVEQEYFNLDKTESITIKIPKDTVKISQTKVRSNYHNLLPAEMTGAVLSCVARVSFTRV